ncbi:MAG TPA: class C sortase [Candidatus Eubacterium avistercoris]|uniref:Class C sortase n=1 Tax=Candidatus Eubacterium avistercoris TaxID=2838567 RepID=A0A9D2D223_9FIRM|nr:class C sortase [Candidatus Eubacterium avistercoris]
MKGKYKKITAAILMIFGGVLMCYPWISNWFYDHGVESSVNVYQKKIEKTDDRQLRGFWEDARMYNQALSRSEAMLTDPFTETEVPSENVSYYEILNTDGSGRMCFVDIPKIAVYLPVFHGTSAEVLRKGAGHLEGSSLPVGGRGTHAVVSAHTGINSSKLFSDLTEMEEGDLFFIHVLDKTMAYRVTKISVIRPEETSMLKVEKDKDLVSLVTCTPYGVNTHRLVVTGERTAYSEQVRQEAQKEKKPEKSKWMQAYKKAVLTGMAAASGAAAVTECAGRIKNRKERKRGHEKNMV